MISCPPSYERRQSVLVLRSHGHITLLLYQPTCASSVLLCVIWVFAFDAANSPTSELADVSLHPVFVSGSKMAVQAPPAGN